MIAANDNFKSDRLFAESVIDPLVGTFVRPDDREVLICLVEGLVAQDEGEKHAMLGAVSILLREREQIGV